MIEFRLLRADEIDARVSTVNDKGCSVLLYKDARCDMNILDETLGVENWQRQHEVVNGNLFCNVGIWVDRNGYGEWVWKQDVGTESYTEKEKGQASDSFKRACFNLGIGRELYTAPFIWFGANEVNLATSGGKTTTYDRFEVTDIQYQDRKITSVTVLNTKTKKAKTFKNDLKGSDTRSDDAKVNPGNGEIGAKRERFMQELKRTGFSLKYILDVFNVKTIDEMDEAKLDAALTKFSNTADGVGNGK